MNDINPAGQAAGTALTTGFGSNTQVVGGVESAGTAMAAKAKATVEARYIMAMRNPRNWDQVRVDILRDCKRPSFANSKRSYYVKPVGDGVEGLGIGFIEAALRHMRNVSIETSVIFEDDNREIHGVVVTDLEANLPYQMEVKVSKTVERSRPADDGTFISVRKNSRNKPVYTVPGTDDDILNKRNALLSKAIRALGERLIPADLKEEAIDIIKAVRMDEAAKDPDKTRKVLADLFAEIGVKPTDLAAYLGHDLSVCSPKELAELRALHGAISNGEATWAEALDNKAQNNGDDKQDGKRKEPPPYADADFAANLPAWRKAIAAGKATAEQIIARSSTKYVLSEDQKAAIRAPAEPPKDAPPVDEYGVIDDDFVKSYESQKGEVQNA